MTLNDGEYPAHQKRSDEKKQRILNSAMKLFSEAGYHKTTAKGIAADAGVAVGSFYRYFRDKKAVFLALCLRSEEEIGIQIFETGKRLRESGISESEVICKLIRFSVESHRKNAGFHREVLIMEHRDDDVAELVRSREKRTLASLTAFMKSESGFYRVSDLEAAAELIYGTVEEVSHRAVLFESVSGEERLVCELQKMLKYYLFGS